MTIEAALFAELSSFPGLSGLVEDKIYPMQADQRATLPYVVFTLIHGKPHNVMNAAPTLKEDTFQVSAFAVTALAAIEIKAQVKAAIQGFNGVMGGVGGVSVGACLVENERALFEADPKVFHQATDFLIFYNAV